MTSTVRYSLILCHAEACQNKQRKGEREKEKGEKKPSDQEGRDAGFGNQGASSEHGGCNGRRVDRAQQENGSV